MGSYQNKVFASATPFYKFISILALTVFVLYITLIFIYLCGVESKFKFTFCRVLSSGIGPLCFFSIIILRTYRTKWAQTGGNCVFFSGFSISCLSCVPNWMRFFFLLIYDRSLKERNGVKTEGYQWNDEIEPIIK